ncbi:MAG: ATP-binding protein [Clostridia bacterium]
MKKVKLKWQIIAITTLVVIILTIFISYMTNNNFRDYYIQSLIDNMDQNNKLIGEHILSNNNYLEEIEAETENHAKITDSRVTIINLDGKVLADSSYEKVSEMDNHIDRKEVVEAIRSGTGHALRYSNTLKSNMLYYAYILEEESNPALIIRTAIPLTRIENYLQSQFYRILIATLIALITLVIINSLLISKLLSPIEKVQNAFKSLNKGNYDIYLSKENSSLEAHNLIKSFNNMSTQIKNNIDEIVKRELELNTLIKSMNSGLLFIDNDEKVKLINPKAREFLEYNDKEGIHYIKISRKPSISNNIEKSFVNKESLNKEIEVYDNNLKRYFQLLINPLFKDDNFMGLIVLLYDITDIKISEKARSDLIANVSHELKTPITSIAGFIETIKEMDPADPKVFEFLNIIEKESEKLKRLVQDLLELAKLESKNFKLKKEYVKLDNLFNSILKVLQPRIAQKSLVVNTQIEKDFKIYSDPLRLEQIFYNIIDNAIKYSNQNGKIFIKAHNENNHAFISIKDTGIGIEKSKISRVTEQFYREEESRSKLVTDGYGLGLAIVKNLVDLLDGELEIISEYNKGTNVIIKLPKVDV